MLVNLGGQAVNYSRLLRLSREQPLSREMRLSPSDFRIVAVKEPTRPVPPVRPNDAPHDWKPEEPPPVTQMRFDAGDRSVLVVPDMAVPNGVVDVR